MLRVIRQSSARAWRRCPTLYRYAYEMGRVPVVQEDADARSFGTLVHVGLEEWWQTRSLDRALEAIEVGRYTGNEYRHAMAAAMLTGYHARWSHENYETVATELEFEVPLRWPGNGLDSGWTIQGRFDGLARIGGRLLLVEHKTSSEDITPGAPYWQKLRLDLQVSTYVIAARRAGYEVEGVLYDVLLKPQSRPRLATPPEERKYTKAGVLYAAQRDRDETPGEYEFRLTEAIAEAPERYYQRSETVRIADELEDAERQLCEITAEIEYAHDRGWWAKSPDHCFQYARPCDYWDVCTGCARIDGPAFKERER